MQDDDQYLFSENGICWHQNNECECWAEIVARRLQWAGRVPGCGGGVLQWERTGASQIGSNKLVAELVAELVKSVIS